jgi:uncharacterized protein (DUF4415 family)
MKGDFMKTDRSKKPKMVIYRREPGSPLTAKQRANLEELLSRPNRKIDTSDIPELPPGAWEDAVRGKFYRPVKKAVSLRLDADVIAWLKKDGKGYQTRANRVLREKMLKEMAG